VFAHVTGAKEIPLSRKRAHQLGAALISSLGVDSKKIARTQHRLDEIT
jgi:hypothetical protein